MPHEIVEELTKKLGNKQAGWVTRRDAADALGLIAREALTALHEHSAEEDVDVRTAVEKALQQCGALAHGDAARKTPARFSLEELAQAVEKKGSRAVAPSGAGYIINCSLRGGRKQQVRHEPHQRRDGVELVRVYTVCGPATDRAYGWALRANLNISQGALALADEDGKPHLVLMNCYLAETVTPTAVLASVRELSAYGDWIGRKLSGLDEL